MPERLPPNIHFTFTTGDETNPNLQPSDKEGEGCRKCEYLQKVCTKVQKAHNSQRGKRRGPTETKAHITCSARKTRTREGGIIVDMRIIRARYKTGFPGGSKPGIRWNSGIVVETIDNCPRENK